MIPAPKKGSFTTLAENFKSPGQGSIKKVGNKAYFTFEVVAPVKEFKSMQEAKDAFSKHHARLQKIADRYFYMFIRAKVRKHGGFRDIKHDVVGKVLQKLGFIDEN